MHFGAGWGKTRRDVNDQSISDEIPVEQPLHCQRLRRIQVTLESLVGPSESVLKVWEVHNLNSGICQVHRYSQQQWGPRLSKIIIKI